MTSHGFQRCLLFLKVRFRNGGPLLLISFLLLCFLFLVLRSRPGNANGNGSAAAAWLPPWPQEEGITDPAGITWQLPSRTTENTPKAAILYLIRDSGMNRANRPTCPTMSDSLTSVFTHFLKLYPVYPVFFLYEEGGISKAKPEIIKQMDDLNREHDIHIEYKFILVNMSTNWNEKLHPRTAWTYQVEKDFPGYTNMCQFWFTGVRQVPQVKELDYYLRLDQDSCFFSDLPDFFMFSKVNNIAYIYQSIFLEPDFAMVNYHDFSRKWVRSTFPGQKGLFESMQRLKQVAISNNFEVLKLKAFRSDRIQAFERAVDEFGGIPVHRWGDALLRVTQLVLLEAPERIFKFCLFDYGHSSWDKKLAKDCFVSHFGLEWEGSPWPEMHTKLLRKTSHTRLLGGAYSPMPCSFAYQDFEDYCKKSKKKLCSYAEVCPGGEGGNPTHGRLFNLWLPVEEKNSWAYLGGSSFMPCARVDSPSWGNSELCQPERSPVLCCPAK